MIFPSLAGTSGLAMGHVISNAQQAGAIASAESRAYARGQIDALRLDMERVLMITEALWELLKLQHGYTDEQLLEHVRRIDAQDGRIDGRAGRIEGSEPSPCPSCGRMLSRRRPVCIYCGAHGSAQLFPR